MPPTSITSKGQVTIPKAIREVLGVRPGDRVVFVQQPDGKVVVEPETRDVRSLRGLLKHTGRPVTLEEMDEAIARAAAASGER